MPKRTNRRTYKTPTRGAKPEVNRVLRKLRNLGLHLEYSAGAGHWRVIDPGTGAFLTTVSNTPSDVNFWQQVRRAVEKAGYSWNARKRSRRPRGTKISAVDLEALGHAQALARQHGQREPQIDDLDPGLLARIRQEYSDKQSEEASTHMATGVESARAHRVVARLLSFVEKRGNEMAARAKERNPNIRDGGAGHEILHHAQRVAYSRGLRYWKTPESAWNFISGILRGNNTGMSIWAANLIEATLDEMEKLDWGATPATSAEPVKPKSETTNGKSKAAVPLISIDEAKGLILDLVSSDWTPRADIHSTLVPEQMSQSRFDDAMKELLREDRFEWEYEKKKGGGRLYRLIAAAEPEPVTPEPEIEPFEDAIDPNAAKLPRTILQGIPGGSIADRYADVLLDVLRSQNGNADWTGMEPILSRLDRLAGIGVDITE